MRDMKNNKDKINNNMIIKLIIIQDNSSIIH